MRRRDFVAGAAVTLGLADASAQATARLPKLGILLTSLSSNPLPNDPEDFRTLFRDALAKLGWIDGKTIRIERSYMVDAAEDAATLQARARQLVALEPDVIFVATTPAVDAVRKETNTIPIVFSGINDPLAAGFVSSLAHPGGNITGFANYEPSSFGKMIAVLKDAVPHIRTIALMYRDRTQGNDLRDRRFPREILNGAARAHSVELVDARVGDEQDIERIFAKLAEDQKTGVLFQPDQYLQQQRTSIVASAARNRVPTIYSFSNFVSAGGLMAYSFDIAEQALQAAAYIDRILKGANPGDLPVQLPTHYELTINMRAANALGITIPPSLLSIADKVIE